MIRCRKKKNEASMEVWEYGNMKLVTSNKFNYWNDKVLSSHSHTPILPYSHTCSTCIVSALVA